MGYGEMPASRQMAENAPATLKRSPVKQSETVRTRLLKRQKLRFATPDPQVNRRAASAQFEPHVVPARPLKLLTFNIQVGIKTDRYRQYLTRGWKHVLPHLARQENLTKIAEVVQQYDLVALQEIDSGSLRSGFLNQVEYLAERADFPYWYMQTNRDLGMFAQHGNGLLSRIKPATMEDHKLPGIIPGRGAIIVRVPYAGRQLTVVLLHLSLGARSRETQLNYLAEQLDGEELVVVMGDLNSHMAADVLESPLGDLGLEHPAVSHATFPAWQPQLALDHILVSPALEIRKHEVLSCHISDHLPIGVTLALSE